MNARLLCFCLISCSALTAQTAKERAEINRAAAMSFAFDGDCAKTSAYEQRVIDYWLTREIEDPVNAYYQEGEVADEAGRVCLDLGELDTAEQWYRRGFEMGTKDPALTADRKALWDFRLAHAEARIAARRGNGAAADQYVGEALAALERMTASKQQQQIFVPYLTGYVAFYRGDYQKALGDLLKANQNDPFIQCLTAQTYEKLGQNDKALELYRKAAASQARNPPAAYAVPFATKKLREAR